MIDRAPHLARAGSRRRKLSLLCLTAIFLASCEYEEVEIELGYKGPARSNPFLAAERILDEFGYLTERHQHFSLPHLNDVLFVTGESGFSEGRSQEILSWVEGGGSLIYFYEGTRPYDDFAPGESLRKFLDLGKRELEVDPLLRALGVSLVLPSAETRDSKEVQADGVAMKVEMPMPVAFSAADYPDEPDLILGSKENAAVLGLPYGSGHVSLLSHAQPLRNRYVGSHDHPDFLLRLMGTDDSARNVHFVFTQRSHAFWRLLWERGSMVLLGLLALTFVWLWQRMPRFGPIKNLELTPLRRFSEHLRVAGRFFWRQRRADYPLAAACLHLRGSIAVKHPQYRGANDATLIPWLAERSGLPEERVRELLSPGATRQAATFVDQMHDLQTLHLAL